MKEMRADLWEVEADLRVITTNGTIKKNGEAVLGRGCAKEAALKEPRLSKFLGRHLLNNGNIPFIAGFPTTGWLATLPVKHNWWERADIDLIVESTKSIVEWADACEYTNVVIPRPGCGNGQLKWEDVKPMIETLLDDRFTVVTK